MYFAILLGLALRLSGTDTADRGAILCSSRQTDFRQSARCGAVDGLRFASREDENFLWRGSGDRLLWFGTTAGNRVHLDPKPGRVKLHIDEELLAALSSDVTLSLFDARGDRWAATLSSASLPGDHLIVLPVASYRLVLEGEDIRTVLRERVAVSEDNTLRLPDIRLSPAPFVQGAVYRASDRAPIPGAVVALSNAKTVATTNTGGKFEFRQRPDPTSFISISAPGFAPHTIDTSKIQADTKLAPVYLSPGGALRVHFERRCDDRCRTSFRLYRQKPNPTQRDSWTQISARESFAQEGVVVFDSIDAGTHWLLVGGERSLQRKIVQVRIREGEASDISVSVRDRLLKGVVTRGSQPLPRAALTFSPPQGIWSATIETDDSGQYEAVLWDSAPLTLSVVPAGERDAFTTIQSLTETEEQFWDVAIPEGVIKGRVIDADTRQPIEGADVEDTFSGDGSRRQFRSRPTNGDGTFEITMLPVGEHTIRVTAAGYLDRPPLVVGLSERDESRLIDLELKRGEQVTLRITSAEGEPVPGARVYDWVGDLGLERRIPYFADAFGMVSIPMKAGAQKPVYVLTDDGRFAIALVHADGRHDRTEVMLSPAVASLTLTATSGRETVSGVQFLVRVDGRFLPPAIWDLISGSLRASSTQTRSDGRIVVPSLPVGTYEFWPYRTVDELRALFSIVHSEEPVRITLQPGSNALAVPVHSLP